MTCESFAGGVIGVAEGTNVRLEGSTVQFYGLSFIEAKAYGGIVGSLRAGSSLTRSSAEGAILRVRHFGGIAGVCLEGSTIHDAFARLDVALESEGIAGGALGTADGCSVKNVYTASTMTLMGGQPVEAVSGFVSAATSTEALSGDACRSARFLLGWSLRHLADISRVHKDTNHKFENGANVHDRTRHDLRRAFEDAGVEFVEGEERAGYEVSLPSGWVVRMRPESEE